jgi:hypothetical protein
MTDQEPTRAVAAWQRARSGQVQHKALMGFRTLRDMHDTAPIAFEKMEFVKPLGGTSSLCSGYRGRWRPRMPRVRDVLQASVTTVCSVRGAKARTLEAVSTSAPAGSQRMHVGVAKAMAQLAGTCSATRAPMRLIKHMRF